MRMVPACRSKASRRIKEGRCGHGANAAARDTGALTVMDGVDGDGRSGRRPLHTGDRGSGCENPDEHRDSHQDT
jgi:hypothetical protein